MNALQELALILFIVIGAAVVSYWLMGIAIKVCDYLDLRDEWNRARAMQIKAQMEPYLGCEGTENYEEPPWPCLEEDCGRPAVKNGGCEVHSTGIYADEYADPEEREAT